LKPVTGNHIEGTPKLSEQHPREQGLKRTVVNKNRPEFKLSEQHPREQGLKRGYLMLGMGTYSLSEQHPREQGLKLTTSDYFSIAQKAFRATSKRTRIETICLTAAETLNPPFRATSKRTRIETNGLCPKTRDCRDFQSNIQENKD